MQSKQLYFQIKNWIEKVDIALPKSNSVDIILGVDEKMTNYIILMFKISLYKAKEKCKVPSLTICL